MKRYIFFAIVVCLISQSEALAQQRGGGIIRGIVREVGVPFLQNELQRGLQRQQPQPGNQGPGIQSSAMPSEPGQGSGGNRNEFNPDLGFLLPGSGGQPAPIDRPIFQPGSQPGDQPQPYQPQPYQPQPGYQPQPYQPQPQTLPYYQPQPTPGATMPGVVTVPATSYTSGDLPGTPVMSNQYVVIRCPSSMSGSISYTLSSNGTNMRFTMSPGQEQRFRVSSIWSISYQDGQTQRKYAVRGGRIYTFKQKADGQWQVYSEET